MKKRSKIIVTCLFFMTTIGYTTELKDLKCNGQINPVGIVDAHPTFSWTFIGDKKSAKQSGYRIMMVTSIEKLKYLDLWDTGATSTSETGAFEYCGEPLKFGQRIYWKVTAWSSN